MNSTTPNGQEAAEDSTGLTALLSWQTIRKGLEWSCGSGECAHTSEYFMFEAFLVTLTLVASTWGGWVFSRFYFTDGTSQVSARPCKSLQIAQAMMLRRSFAAEA